MKFDCKMLCGGCKFFAEEEDVCVFTLVRRAEGHYGRTTDLYKEEWDCDL